MTTLIMGILTMVFVLLTAFYQTSTFGANTYATPHNAYDTLKTVVFGILDNKCNQCHRKQNPFMLFNPKNMERRASKIYQMVFVKRRMPKGDQVRLTTQEYNILKKWLSTKNNNLSW